ncbi:MAG: class I SAM-dependent methyltransferase [archaeon]
MNMEYAKCGLCGADEAKYLFSATDYTYGVKGNFDLVKCNKCGLSYMNPRPKKGSLSELYPKKYFAFSEDNLNPRQSFNSFLSRKEEDVLKEWINGEKFSFKKLASLPHYLLIKEFDHTFIPTKNRGRILDVGCGIGGCLLKWRQQGWGVSGVELDKGAVNYAKKKFNLNVFFGTLERSKFKKNYFDVITTFHLLEHVQEPKAVLMKARELLKEKGELIIVTPNFDSLESKVFGKEWWNIDAPRHFYHFTPKTLGRMIEESGFKIEKIKYNVSPNIFLDGINSYFTRKKIPLKVNNSFFAFLLMPFYCLLSFFRCGGSMAFYVKKK